MKKRKKPLLITILAVLCLIFVLFAMKWLPHIAGHWEPDYEKQNISALASKKTLAESDYKTLFYQTGLSKVGVDAVRQKGEDLLIFQDGFFQKPKIHCEQIGAVTYEDRLDESAGYKRPPLVPLENGDILLSFSTHTVGWRHGHGGLITDAAGDRVLEAAILGSNSSELWVSHWQRYSDFMVLRLKGADKKQRQEIADFAVETLNEIPYKLTSGIFGEKAPPVEGELGAQCAYIIWYAYQHFGYDLDSNGGRVVTIKDLAESDKLEVVQVYGLDPEKWGHYH